MALEHFLITHNLVCVESVSEAVMLIRRNQNALWLSLWVLRPHLGAESLLEPSHLPQEQVLESSSHIARTEAFALSTKNGNGSL